MKTLEQIKKKIKELIPELIYIDKCEDKYRIIKGTERRYNIINPFEINVFNMPSFSKEILIEMENLILGKIQRICDIYKLRLHFSNSKIGIYWRDTYEFILFEITENINIAFESEINEIMEDTKQRLLMSYRKNENKT
jgi:hypothetical protein